MKRRHRLSTALTAAGLLLVAVAVIGLMLRDGGDESAASGPLSWSAGPKLYTPPRLPADRVLSGRVENDSVRRVRLVARDLRLVDRSGRGVGGSAVFLDSFVHGLYPPTREPRRLPESELRRTGRLAVVEPGKSVPLTVSWRQGRGRERRPVRLDYGRGWLSVPGA